MEAPFDLEGLVKSLTEFRDSVSFHLTDEPPVPAEIAEGLWRAHDAVVGALEELRRRYGFSEAGWTAYAPGDVNESEN